MGAESAKNVQLYFRFDSLKNQTINIIPCDKCPGLDLGDYSEPGGTNKIKVYKIKLAFQIREWEFLLLCKDCKE